MRFVKLQAICLSVLILCGCAGGSRISSSEFSEELKKFPIRPWYARQVLSGDPEKKIEYYGVQLKLRF